MSNLPPGAKNDPSAPYNEGKRKNCEHCNQELIESEGYWYHEFGSCPAFCDFCGTKLLKGNHCPKCDIELF